VLIHRLARGTASITAGTTPVSTTGRVHRHLELRSDRSLQIKPEGRTPVHTPRGRSSRRDFTDEPSWADIPIGAASDIPIGAAYGLEHRNMSHTVNRPVKALFLFCFLLCDWALLFDWSETGSGTGHFPRYLSEYSFLYPKPKKQLPPFPK
jgi:hypothetical protein